MRFLVALLASALLVVALGHYLLPFIPSFFYQTIVLLFLGTAGIYYYLVDIQGRGPRYFVQLYLLTLVVKLVAYGGYILFVLWKRPGQGSENAGVFMVAYMLFTALEIGFLYQKVRGKKG